MHGTPHMRFRIDLKRSLHLSVERGTGHPSPVVTRQMDSNTRNTDYNTRYTDSISFWHATYKRILTRDEQTQTFDIRMLTYDDLITRHTDLEPATHRLWFAVYRLKHATYIIWTHDNQILANTRRTDLFILFINLFNFIWSMANEAYTI